jgi:biopolymer transport protein ExbD
MISSVMLYFSGSCKLPVYCYAARDLHRKSFWTALTSAREATVRALLIGLGVVVSSLVAAGAAAQAPDDGAAFVLRVDSEGSFSLPSAVTPLDEAAVVAQAAAALSRNAGVELVVEADTAAPYQRVTRAAVLLQQAGATKISFRTRNADQR